MKRFRRVMALVFAVCMIFSFRAIGTLASEVSADNPGITEDVLKSGPKAGDAGSKGDAGRLTEKDIVQGEMPEKTVGADSEGETGSIHVTLTVKHNGEIDTENSENFGFALFQTVGTGNVRVSETKTVTTVKGIAGVEFNDLPLGTYYVVQMEGNGPAGSEFREYIVTGDGQEVVLERGSLTADVEIVNDRVEKCRITVNKTVKFNGEIDTECNEDFSVALFMRDRSDIHVTGPLVQYGDPKVIHVKDGVGSVEFANLPRGIYWVYEMDGDERVSNAMGEYAVIGSGTELTLVYGTFEGTADIVNSRTDKGQIIVNKEVFYADALDLKANAETYRVGLFTKDGEEYREAGDPHVQNIITWDGKGSVTFSNLEPGTYYVFELDGNGNRIEDHYDSRVLAVTGSGSRVELTESVKTGEVTIRNTKLATGEIVVRKLVMNKGIPYVGYERDFYAGVFTKKGDEYEQVGETKAFSMKNGDGMAEFEDIPFGTYYVFEMQDGERVGDTLDDYEVTGSGQEVVVSRENAIKLAVIINNKTETGKTETATVTPTETAAVTPTETVTVTPIPDPTTSTAPVSSSPTVPATVTSKPVVTAMPSGSKATATPPATNKTVTPAATQKAAASSSAQKSVTSAAAQKSATSAAGKTTNAKTGDESPIEMYVVLLAAAMTVIVALRRKSVAD